MNSNNQNNIYNDYNNNQSNNNQINPQVNNLNNQSNNNMQNNQTVYQFPESSNAVKKRNIYKILSMIFLILVIISLSGVALVYTGVIKINNISPKSLLLNIGNIGLSKGSGYQYEYQIYPENTTDKRVYFESSDESIFEVNEVSGYIEGKKEGTANLIIKSSEDNSVLDTSLITITKEKIPVEKILLSSERVVFDLSNSDSEMLLKISTEPYNATDKKFDFYSSDNTVAIIDRNGKITPTGFGRAIITVSTKDGSVKAECEVYVTDSENQRVYFSRPDNSKIVFPYDIKLEFDNLKLKPGDSRKVGFTLLPPDVTEDVVTWISADSKVATVKEGLITGVSVGTTTIIAKTVNDLVATLQVEVTEEEILPKKLSFSENQVVLNIYEKMDLKLNYDPFSTISNFAWSSSDPSVVEVSENGKITGLKTGEATIIVSLPNDNTIRDEIKVIVTEIENTSSVLISDIPKIEVNTGGTEQLQISTGEDKDASLEYEIKDSSVATINENGLIIGRNEGETIVTATNGEGLTIDIPIKVEAIQPTKIEIISDSDVLNVGDTIEIITNVYPNNATNKNVIYTTNNSSVSVSEDGLVKALKVGTAVITAKLGDLEAQYTIKVVSKSTTVTKDKLDENKVLEPLTTAEKLKLQYMELTAAYVGGGKIEIIADFSKYGFNDYVKNMTCIGASEDESLQAKVNGKIVSYNSKYSTGTIVLGCNLTLNDNSTLSLIPRQLNIKNLKISTYNRDTTPNSNLSKASEIYESLYIDSTYSINDKNCKSKDTTVATIKSNGGVVTLKQRGIVTIECDTNDYVLKVNDRKQYSGKLGDKITLDDTSCKSSNLTVATVNDESIVELKHLGTSNIRCDFGLYTVQVNPESNSNNNSIIKPTETTIDVTLNVGENYLIDKNLTCTTSNNKVAVYNKTNGYISGTTTGSATVTCTDSNKNKTIYKLKISKKETIMQASLNKDSIIDDTNCTTTGSSIVKITKSDKQTIFTALKTGTTVITCDKNIYNYNVKAVQRETRTVTIRKDESYMFEDANCTTKNTKAKISSDGTKVTFNDVGENISVQCDNLDYIFTVSSVKKNVKLGTNKIMTLENTDCVVTKGSELVNTYLSGGKKELSCNSAGNVEYTCNNGKEVYNLECYESIVKNETKQEFVIGECYSCQSGSLYGTNLSISNANCSSGEYSPIEEGREYKLECLYKTDKVNDVKYLNIYKGVGVKKTTLNNLISISHTSSIAVGQTLVAKFTDYNQVKELGNARIKARYSNGMVIKEVNNQSSLSFQITSEMLGKYIYLEFSANNVSTIIKSLKVEANKNCHLQSASTATIDGLKATFDYSFTGNCQLSDFTLHKCSCVETYTPTISGNKLKVVANLYDKNCSCNFFVEDSMFSNKSTNLSIEKKVTEEKSEYEFGVVNTNSYQELVVGKTKTIEIAIVKGTKFYTDNAALKLVDVKVLDSSIATVSGNKLKAISTGETTLQFTIKETKEVYTIPVKVIAKKEKDKYVCYGYQKISTVYNCDKDSEYSIYLNAYGIKACYSNQSTDKCKTTTYYDEQEKVNVTKRNSLLYTEIDGYCVNPNDYKLATAKQEATGNILLSTTMPISDKYVGQYSCNVACDKALLADCTKK